ncbi:MAG: hypothetical protein RL846_12750 [Deltaproteobacteria bacterium]
MAGGCTNDTGDDDATAGSEKGDTSARVGANMMSAGASSGTISSGRRAMMCVCSAWASVSAVSMPSSPIGTGATGPTRPRRNSATVDFFAGAMPQASSAWRICSAERKRSFFPCAVARSTKASSAAGTSGRPGGMGRCRYVSVSCSIFCAFAGAIIRWPEKSS